MTVARPPQANLTRESHKRGPDRAGGQTHPVLGDEKAGAFRDGIDAIARLDIPTERLLGSQMQWQTTRLAKFAVADGEESVFEIDIVIVQPHEFTDAHAGDHEQAEDRRVRVGAKPRGRG